MNSAPFTLFPLSARLLSGGQTARSEECDRPLVATSKPRRVIVLAAAFLLALGRPSCSP